MTPRLEAVMAARRGLARDVCAGVRAAIEPLRRVEVALLPFHDGEQVLGIAAPRLVGHRFGDRERGYGAVARSVELGLLDVRARDHTNEPCRLRRVRRAAIAQRGLVQRARLEIVSLPLERLTDPDHAEHRRLAGVGETVVRDGGRSVGRRRHRSTEVSSGHGRSLTHGRTRAGSASNSTHPPLSLPSPHHATTVARRMARRAEVSDARR